MSIADLDIRRSIYLALEHLDQIMADENGSVFHVNKWLNDNGYCNLTVCPVCHVDDFVHVEGCELMRGADLNEDDDFESIVFSYKKPGT